MRKDRHHVHMCTTLKVAVNHTHLNSEGQKEEGHQRSSGPKPAALTQMMPLEAQRRKVTIPKSHSSELDLILVQVL